MPFSSLPNEIVEFVVAACADKRKTLDALSRVAKRFRPLCQKQLFRTISVAEKGVERDSDYPDGSLEHSNALNWMEELKLPHYTCLPIERAVEEPLHSSPSLLSCVNDLVIHQFDWDPAPVHAKKDAKSMKGSSQLHALTLHWEYADV